MIDGGVHERRRIRVAHQRFGVVALDGANSGGAERRQADPLTMSQPACSDMKVLCQYAPISTKFYRRGEPGAMNTGSARSLYLQTCYRGPYLRTCHQGRAKPWEGVMHPMFVQLFMETDADELAYEEDRRRSRRTRRVQSRTVTRAAAPVRTTPRQAGSRP
jgi:hypothetical protein